MCICPLDVRVYRYLCKSVSTCIVSVPSMGLWCCAVLPCMELFLSSGNWYQERGENDPASWFCPFPADRCYIEYSMLLMKQKKHGCLGLASSWVGRPAITWMPPGALSSTRTAVRKLPCHCLQTCGEPAPCPNPILRKGKTPHTEPLSSERLLLLYHLVSKSRPALCDPMDCSLPGSSVHVILQAKILVWVAISFSRGSSHPKNRTWVSCIGKRILYH